MRREVRDLQRRFGSRVQSLRHARGLTQDQLADVCGVSQKYLSELERGVKAPSFETLVALAHRGFKIKLAALLFAVDEGAPNPLVSLDQVVAGRGEEARDKILRAVGLLVEAGRHE